MGLNAAQNGAATGFVFIGVRVLAGDVFIPATTMTEQGAQITLGAGGKEQTGCFASTFGKGCFQKIDRRVIPINIIPQGGFQHRGAHPRARLGDRIAS